MTKFVAFLRGINVGGHNKIKMQVLRELFSSLGFEKVSTLGASGNVLFQSPLPSSKLIDLIELKLLKFAKSEVKVMLRSREQLQEIIKLQPFKKNKDASATEYATFLHSSPAGLLSLPVASKNGDVEVLSVKGLDVFSLARVVSGRGGYPNGFIETKLKVPATTRNWGVVKEIVEKL